MSKLNEYRVVEKAIRYLWEHAERQPSLEDVAEHVSLSKYHFHRTFRGWAGVTPKQFLSYLTIERAKSLLRDAQPVLRAAHESGLSGAGRLHDLFVTVEAMTPGEYRRAGAGVGVRYAFYPSPFGEALLAATDRGLCAVGFTDDRDRAAAVADLAERWPGAELIAAPEIAEEFAGRIFPIPSASGRIRLHLKGTNFQLRVWEALLRIPAGKVVRYGDVARAVGAPRAARAVGAAVGSNPIAYLIPCHRVIRSTGTIGDYRWGSDRKRAMLGWEGARASA